MEVAVFCVLVQVGQKIGPVKRLRKKSRMKFEQLKKITEYFIYVRDAVEKQKIKQLLKGNMPRKECKAWLERAEEIVHRVNNILKSEAKSSDSLVFFLLNVRDPLMRMLEEVADQLEKSVELGLLIDEPHKIREKVSIPKSQGKKDMIKKEKIEMASSQEKTGTRIKPALSAELSLELAPYEDPLPRLSKDSLQDPRTVMPFKGKVRSYSLQDLSTAMPFEFEGRRLITGGEKYKYDYEAATVGEVSTPTSEVDTIPEKLDASGAKNLTLHVSRQESESEQEIEYFQETEASPMHDTGIEFVSAVSEDFSMFKETEIVEFDHDPSGEVRTDTKKLEEPINPPVDVKVATHGTTPGDQMSPKPAVNGTSSNYETVQKILKCLRVGTARRIGIYGSGGIGKTTVLKALANHTNAHHMFDKIIWVTLSRHSGTINIKNQIVEQLLSLPPAGYDTKLEDILHAFRSKKVLFLLDNVLEKIDLDAVGIPNPDLEKGCTIILTTRSPDVCHIMEVDTQFELSLLSMEESWKLFHDQVGGTIDPPDIEPYARAIVAACGGLPLTIVVTGRALREENNVSMWQHALLEFLSLIASSKQGAGSDIQKLKFCYNKLKSRGVKDCFLYCALVHEDRGVNISELIKYFTSEGLVAKSLADPYVKGHNVVEILLSASLLERMDDGLYVKMPDVIRDLASVIMSREEEGCQFLVGADIRLTMESENGESEFSSRTTFEGHQLLLGAGAGVTEPPPNEKWEQAKMIFLMDNELSSLPGSPFCPNLLTLFLQRNNRLRAIPMSFFDRMPRLQIVNLSKTRINSLPPSLFKLKLLKVLLLRDCKHISMLPREIGVLEHLELLDMRETEIYDLPNEIGNLTCLRHLVVSFYGTNDRGEYAMLPPILIPTDILSRFVQLNELSIDVYPGDRRWSRSVKSISNEVVNLKQLKNLSFYFPEVKLLELFIQESISWKSRDLTKFKFIVGHNVKRLMARVPDDVEIGYNQQDRCLRFVNGETVSGAVVEVLGRATAFYLDHHLSVQSLSEFGASTVNALEFCIIGECHGIKTVIDSKGQENSALATFPVLENLVLHFLWNLTSIWVGPMPSGSLSMLQFLSVQSCPRLSFVLTSSMLGNLYNLEVLVVEDCQAIENVVFEDREFGLGDIMLPKLRKLRLHYLPNLVSIWKGSSPCIEHMSFYNCPNLKSLPMGYNVIKSVKEIRAEKKWWDELIWEDTSLYLQLQAYFTEIWYGHL